MEVCAALTTNPRTDTDTFGTPERIGFLSWTIVALFVRKFNPIPFATDGAAGVRCGEYPVPKHRVLVTEQMDGTSPVLSALMPEVGLSHWRGERRQPLFD